MSDFTDALNAATTDLTATLNAYGQVRQAYNNVTQNPTPAAAATAAPASNTVTAQSQGIGSSVLLVGGVVVVFLLLRNKG